MMYADFLEARDIKSLKIKIEFNFCSDSFGQCKCQSSSAVTVAQLKLTFLVDACIDLSLLVG